MEIFNDFERLNTIVSGVSETINIGNTVDVSASALIPISGTFISNPTDIQFDGTKVTYTTPLPISGDFGIVFPDVTTVSGSILVSNFPSIQKVEGVVGVSSIPDVTIKNIVGISAEGFETIISNPVTVVGVSSIPNITLNNPVTTVGISGIPSVSVTNFPIVQGISALSVLPTSGIVMIQNPTTVVGVSSIPNVNVGNSLFISGSNTLSTYITNPTVGISGTPNVTVGNIIGVSAVSPISISNFPTTQNISASTPIPVSGNFQSTFPSTMGISAESPLSVSITNPQVTVGISGTTNTNITNTVVVSATSPLPVSGSFAMSATDIQFNGTKVTGANPLPVSGNFQSTFPSTMGVSASSPLSVSITNPTTVVGISGTHAVTIGNIVGISASSSLSTIVSNPVTVVGVSSIPNVTISNPVTTVGISGTPSVAISNFPGTQTINGVIGISGTNSSTIINTVGISAANPLAITHSGTQPISGSVSINNLPTIQGVSASSSLPITGNITVSNPQTTVGISGTHSVTVGNTVGISASTPIQITHSGTQPISGSVSILNPIVTVGVSSIPNVTISNPQSIVGISGTPSISVSNFPNIQIVSANSPLPISGSFSAAATDIQFNGTPVTSSNPLPITGNLNTSIAGVMEVSATTPLPISGTVDGNFTANIDGTIGVSADTPLSTNLTSNAVAYWPAQTFIQPGTDVSYVDPAGNLQVRGAFTSDEGSYSNDFNSSATYDILTGTCIFTSGSTQVSGIGTQFTNQLVWGDHVRLSTDAEIYFAQVLSVESDTLMTIDVYNGAGGTGTGYYFGFHPFVGTGGAISVTNSVLRIDSGLTSGANTFIARDIDFQPTACIMRNFYITSNPNEVTPYYGFFDSYDIYSANAGAYVWFSNKELNGGFFITKTSKSIGAQSIIPFTLPNGAMITTPARWRIEVTDDSATLIYNDLIIATSRIHLPALYAPLTFLMGAYNETSSSVSCQMYLDEILFKNVDVINTASVLQTHVQNSSDYITQEYLKELTSIVELLVPTVRAMTNNVAMMVDINGRQRTNVEAGTVTANCNINATQTLATVTTVATVSNQTNIAGYSAADQIPSLINMNGIGLRDKIIVS